MSEPLKIPDTETRRRSVERLRESNRQLDILGLALDELLGIAEVQLCRQRRERLQKKYQRESQKNAE